MSNVIDLFLEDFINIPIAILALAYGLFTVMIWQRMKEMEQDNHSPEQKTPPLIEEHEKIAYHE